MHLAIIDASVDHDGHGPRGPGASRYTTPIANSPLISHVLSELTSSGVSEAVVIAPAAVRRDLARVVGGGRSWGIQISYRETVASEARESVLAEVDQALTHGPVVVHSGDCLFRTQLAAMRDRLEAGDVDSVLARPPLHSTSPSDAAGAVSDSVVMLAPGARPAVNELRSKDLVQCLSDFLLSSNCRLALCEPAEPWYFSDTTEALLTANRMLLDALSGRGTARLARDGNRISGRVAVHPRARISNCVLQGPLAIDEDVVAEDSYIGPYTAIGPGVTVSGAEIANSMILAGAEVRHPGQRIEGSILGERSRVARSFELPTGLHLRLGADTQVMIS